MDQNGPFWSILAWSGPFGPFWSANRTLAIPDLRRAEKHTKCRVHSTFFGAEPENLLNFVFQDLPQSEEF